MEEGNSFSLLVCPQGGGGTPRYLPLPPDQGTLGYPSPHPDHPPARSRQGMWYPKVPTPWPRYLAPQLGQDGGAPRYTTGGMPLAFRQEDFLVEQCISISDLWTGENFRMSCSPVQNVHDVRVSYSLNSMLILLEIGSFYDIVDYTCFESTMKMFAAKIFQSC